MRRLPMFLLVLGCAVGCAAAADEDAPAALRLTLADAVARARTASAGLRALDADVRAADAGIKVAAAQRLPAVDLAASYTRFSDVPELTLTLPDGSVRTIFPDLQDWFFGRIDATYPLYAGGGLAAREAAARADADAARGDRQTGGLDLDLDVTYAYWNLVTAQETDRVLADAMRAYDAHLEDALNREKVGLAARDEVLAVQVARDRAELNRIRAASVVDRATADLARLLDLPPGQGVDPADPLDPGTPPELDVEALVGEALEARPERQALRARITASSERIAVERAGRRPKLEVTAGYDYANPNTRVLPLSAVWNDSWDLRLGFRFPVFDGGHARAAVAQATAHTDSLTERLEDMDRSIRLEVTSRALDVRNAAAAIPVTERSVESARENLKVSRDRYREGVSPSSDLLDAEVALQRAELDRTENQAQLRLALASLERAVGG